METKPGKSFGAKARAFWKRTGVAAFCGLVFGLGFTATKHLPFIPGWLGFSALCGLSLELLAVVRQKRPDEKV